MEITKLCFLYQPLYCIKHVASSKPSHTPKLQVNLHPITGLITIPFTNCCVERKHDSNE